MIFCFDQFLNGFFFYKTDANFEFWTKICFFLGFVFKEISFYFGYWIFDEKCIFYFLGFNLKWIWKEKPKKTKDKGDNKRKRKKTRESEKRG